MSRTSLHRPRRNRAVWDRPANGTRLLPNPYPLSPHLNPHHKRCPRAERLRLRSDQSLSRPVPVTGYGRSPNKNRHALSKGPCQVRAPLTRRTILAPTDDAHEHGVKPLNRAIVPRDSTVVAFGELIPPSDGSESTPPYLRMVGHFWWSRLPHTEIPSRLLHILSEAWGCRRAVADVEHPLWRTKGIGTGVAVFLRNRPGPSIPSPSRFLRHSCGGRSQMRQGVNPSPEGQGPRSSGRTLPFSSRVDRPVAQGVGAPSGASTPLPTHESNRNLPCPSLLHRRLPHPSKTAENFPGEQSYRHELSIESIKSPHRDNPLTQ